MSEKLQAIIEAAIEAAKLNPHWVVMTKKEVPYMLSEFDSGRNTAKWTTRTGLAIEFVSLLEAQLFVEFYLADRKSIKCLPVIMADS